MFERILLPLDGSELSEVAIPYAEELARKLGSEVILYHVHEHSQQEHMNQIYLDRLAESVRHNISQDQPNGKDVKLTTRVETGDAKANICNLVDTNEIDLIIMSAVSVSGLKVGKMLGSVADHICQMVPIPVMLIRPQSVKQTDRKKQLVNNILIPLDGSALSTLALPVAEELAARLKVKATLFQMANMIRIHDDGWGFSVSPNIDYTKLNQDETKRVSIEMAALEKELKAKGTDINNIVTSGFDAASEIIEVCKKNGFDMVVMSTHGHSGLGRWVFGSVAEKVLRHGETPLVLVHARAG